jgi:hypothetical protein
MHRDEAEGGKRPDGIEDIAARVRRVTEMTLERVDCVTRAYDAIIPWQRHQRHPMKAPRALLGLEFRQIQVRNGIDD